MLLILSKKGDIMRKKVDLLDSKENYFPQNIVCLGKNYLTHINEMESKIPEKPMIFLKPLSSLIHSGDNIILPDKNSNVHYEVELLLLIDKKASRIKKKKAYDYIKGYGVGLDITLRDMQTEAKNNGNPWGICKGFDTSAPASSFINKKKLDNPHNIEIKLDVNGKTMQKDNTKNMIFKIPEMLEYITKYITLQEGDIIYTGTPEGVGPIYNGDQLEASLNGNILLKNSAYTQT